MTETVQPILRVLRTSSLPILRQLRLEEYLFRGTEHNWILLNDGSPTTSIVLGLSGYETSREKTYLEFHIHVPFSTPFFVTSSNPHRKLEEMVNIPAARTKGVQVLRRYSGGGTVIVDRNTIFSTLIMNGSQVPGGKSSHLSSSSSFLCFQSPCSRTFSEAFHDPTTTRLQGWSSSPYL